MPPRAHQAAEPADDLAYVPPPGAAPAPPAREMPRRPIAGRDQLLDELLAESTPAVHREPLLARPPARSEAIPESGPAPRRSEAAAPRRTPHELVPEVLDTGDEWWRQVIAEGGAFLLLGTGPVVIDMACTVFGLTRTILPPSLVGMVAAAVLHVFISLGQRHFLVQRGVVRLLGVVLLVINTGLNVYGMIPSLDRWLGQDFLGATLPRDPGQWLPALWSVVWGLPTLVDVWAARWSFAVTLTEGVTPTGFGGAIFGGAGWPPAIVWPLWLPSAIVLTALCALIAWRAEPNLAWWYVRIRHVWRQRPE